MEPSLKYKHFKSSKKVNKFNIFNMIIFNGFFKILIIDFGLFDIFFCRHCRRLTKLLLNSQVEIVP